MSTRFVTASRPEEANGLDGVMASSSDGIWRLHDEQGTTAEITPSPRHVANETVALREAARAGLGVACLPGSFCMPLIETGALVRLLPGWTGPGPTTTLLMPHRRGQLPFVRVVADTLIRELPRQLGSADLLNPG